MSPTSILALALDLLSPRGRCDRKGFLLIAGLLLMLQLIAAATMFASGAGHEGPVGMLLNLIFLWLALTATSKRLHDTGRSAWSILWATLALLVWIVVLVIALMATLGDNAMEPGALGYSICLAGSIGPVFGMTLWLHFAIGSHGPNRYGAEPTGLGFSMPPHRSVSTELALANKTAAA